MLGDHKTCVDIPTAVPQRVDMFICNDAKDAGTVPYSKHAKHNACRPCSYQASCGRLILVSLGLEYVALIDQCVAVIPVQLDRIEHSWAGAAAHRYRKDTPSSQFSKISKQSLPIRHRSRAQSLKPALQRNLIADTPHSPPVSRDLQTASPTA